MTHPWTIADAPLLKGRTAIVSGANRGLGLEITVGLAQAGATVMMACRDARRANSAVDVVRARVPDAQLEVMSLDLAELASIRRFAQEFTKRHERLDLLVNNASAILVPKSKTLDGFEMHIGVNYLGTFALTGLLLPQLEATPGARVVNTASLAHKMTPGLDLADLHFERTPYKDMDAYGRSKLATLVFTFELARRLQGNDRAPTVAAAHPGWSNTNPDQGGLLMRLASRLFAQPAAMGALPALYAATMPDVKGGQYWGPGGFKEMKGYPARADARPEARDAALAQQLWQVSEKATGVRFPD